MRFIESTREPENHLTEVLDEFGRSLYSQSTLQRRSDARAEVQGARHRDGDTQAGGLGWAAEPKVSGLSPPHTGGFPLPHI